MTSETRHVTARTVLIFPTGRKSDGYRPLTYSIMAWASFHDEPRNERFWLFTSLARRLDFAHVQFERVRAGIAELNAPSEYLREAAMEVLADAEAAMTALHRACVMVREVSDHHTGGPLPAILTDQRRIAIKELRDAYEHVESHALGEIDIRKSVDVDAAHSIFLNADLGRELVVHHRVSYRSWYFDLDA